MPTWAQLCQAHTDILTIVQFYSISEKQTLRNFQDWRVGIYLSIFVIPCSIVLYCVLFIEFF